MDKQHILDEIRRTAIENGGQALGRDRFQKVTGIKESDWMGRYWVRWGDAIREAGYTPNTFQPAYSEEFLLERFISLIRELGHFPVQAELRIKARADDTFPSRNTFKRFGNKSGLVAKILEFCSTRTCYEDVIKICQPLQVAPSEDSVPASTTPTFGYVYLVKSGRYYKIGRSNSAGRREYELGIQLPEPTKIVHAIKTDDPPGIEAYWHGRFAAKRKGGEWFELSQEDVQAFRRRKFM